MKRLIICIVAALLIGCPPSPNQDPMATEADSWSSIGRPHGAYGAEAKRCKTPGGWVVVFDSGVCYVPDPEHKWLYDEQQLPAEKEK